MPDGLCRAAIGGRSEKYRILRRAGRCRRAARERPQLPIVALSPVLKTARRLSLVWGLHCVVTEDAHDLDDMVERACRIAHEENFGRDGDRIIITAGVPFGTPGSTNMLRIAYVGAEGQPGA